MFDSFKIQYVKTKYPYYNEIKYSFTFYWQRAKIGKISILIDYKYYLLKGIYLC